MKTETRVGIFILVAIGIFFYLSINIGAIRIDKDQYYSYKAYFDDTGGLDVKAPVKIAGVEVGWVDGIVLHEGGKAEVELMVNKRNRLARNAYAIIQQEGLIGTKSLDIDPGDPSTGYLASGSVLIMPGKSPASIGDLLDKFRDIATSIHDIATSFRTVFASREGEENMKKAVKGIAKASEKLADFSQTLQSTVKRNERNIDDMLTDFRKVAHHLEYGVPTFTEDFHVIRDDLHDDVFPSVKKGFDRVTLAMADDTLPKLSAMGEKAEGAFEQAEEVMEKLNTGKGVLGKLINEDETYGDIKKSLRGFKNFVQKTSSLGVYIDMHTETMLKTSLSKGYLEVKLRSTHDYFYQLQLVADENGSIIRDVIHKEYRYSKGNVLNVDELIDNSRDKIRFAEEINVTARRKNDILFGFQFGKRFNRLALRVGMFESTFGMAADYYVPLNTDKMHWITSVEAFDFRGINRFEDTRPHLKWINRAFFLRNLYTSFGIDDFFSKRSASFFFGGGLRFGDDDLKYFFSMIPIGAFRR